MMKYFSAISAREREREGRNALIHCRDDENIDGHMIFGMTGRQCQTTIAAGKVLMRDRELVGIDEEAENAHILEAAKKLWGDLNHRTY